MSAVFAKFLAREQLKTWQLHMLAGIERFKKETRD